jgi:hypothetical protein
MKARALAAQELREKEIQRELDAKAEQVKAKKRAEDEVSFLCTLIYLWADE